MSVPEVLLLGLLGVFFIIFGNRDETHTRQSSHAQHYTTDIQSSLAHCAHTTHTQPASPDTTLYMCTHISQAVSPLPRPPSQPPPRPAGVTSNAPLHPSIPAYLFLWLQLPCFGVRQLVLHTQSGVHPFTPEDSLIHWQEPPDHPCLDCGLERRGAIYQGIEGAHPLWPLSWGGPHGPPGPWVGGAVVPPSPSQIKITKSDFGPGNTDRGGKWLVRRVK